MIYQK